jgi:hypothetical protein
MILTSETPPLDDDDVPLENLNEFSAFNSSLKDLVTSLLTRTMKESFETMLVLIWNCLRSKRYLKESMLLLTTQLSPHISYQFGRRSEQQDPLRKLQDDRVFQISTTPVSKCPKCERCKDLGCRERPCVVDLENSECYKEHKKRRKSKTVD